MAPISSTRPKPARLDRPLAAHRWMRRPPWPLWAAALFLFQACASAPPPPPTPESLPRPYRVFGTWYTPMPDARGYAEAGIASWYGSDFHGRKTSNGEIYDMHAMTAAHKTLPLGTWVQVRHLDSGQQIVVRINDRGPFVHGRIIDLSYTAAKELDMIGPGTARVEVVALGERHQTPAGDTFVPTDYYSGNFTFQVGAFSSRDNAERLRAELERTFSNAHITPFDRGDAIFYRVRVGHCSDLETAVDYEQHLLDSGYPGVFIVAE